MIARTFAATIAIALACIAGPAAAAQTYRFVPDETLVYAYHTGRGETGILAITALAEVTGDEQPLRLAFAGKAGARTVVDARIGIFG